MQVIIRFVLEIEKKGRGIGILKITDVSNKIEGINNSGFGVYVKSGFFIQRVFILHARIKQVNTKNLVQVMRFSLGIALLTDYYAKHA